MQQAANNLRREGKTISFVPTMGALHEAHLSLVVEAQKRAGVCVVSIFVNPTQFGPGEDYMRYARDLDGDIRKLRGLGVNLVFLPQEEEMYPANFQTFVEVERLENHLCGLHREGHFRGVATVVLKLLNIVKPHVAVFGEKDYQQVLIIRRMVEDLRMDIDIVMVETIREPDGLAMSSRNSYLTPSERRQAPRLYKALDEARKTVREGDRDFYAIGMRGIDELRDAGFRPEYFAIRRASDLGVPAAEDRDLRILAAAWLGSARLIDNVAV